MEEKQIQWFPGHMAKTRRIITESMALTDAVVEIVDSRIPVSSRNPELAGIISNKPVLVVLNKSDLADPQATSKWISKLCSGSKAAIAVSCKTGKGINEFYPAVKELLAEKIEQNIKRGMVGRKLRIMVVGIPNVGKSSFINRICKKNRAKVEDRPGVTRSNQWFSVDKDIELLDTPGVLWPKFEDPVVGRRLAFTGAVKDTVIDIETLAVELISEIRKDYKDLLEQRYKIQISDSEDAYDILCNIGKKRGMVIRGGEIDTERAAVMLIDEYRGGVLGRITLD